MHLHDLIKWKIFYKVLLHEQNLRGMHESLSEQCVLHVESNKLWVFLKSLENLKKEESSDI